MLSKRAGESYNRNDKGGPSLSGLGPPSVPTIGGSSDFRTRPFTTLGRSRRKSTRPAASRMMSPRNAPSSACSTSSSIGSIRFRLRRILRSSDETWFSAPIGCRWLRTSRISRFSTRRVLSRTSKTSLRSSRWATTRTASSRACGSRFPVEVKARTSKAPLQACLPPRTLICEERSRRP